MLGGQRVSEGVCYCGRKVANFMIYLFSATKQDRVSRNPLFTFCSMIYILDQKTIEIPYDLDPLYKLNCQPPELSKV